MTESELSKYILNTILPLGLSTGLSIWFIPKILQNNILKKRQKVIALALAELIKTINYLCIDIKGIDKSKTRSVFIKKKISINFVANVISFDDKIVLAKNILKLYESCKESNIENSISIYEKELEKFEVLSNKLNDVTLRFADFLSNDIIIQMSEVIFAINNIRYEIFENKKILDSFDDDPTEIKLEFAAKEIKQNKLTDTYSKIFTLQSSLLKTEYFDDKI